MSSQHEGGGGVSFLDLDGEKCAAASGCDARQRIVRDLAARLPKIGEEALVHLFEGIRDKFYADAKSDEVIDDFVREYGVKGKIEILLRLTCQHA